jgi:membrane peptidoglycan carboxypeptidase
MDRTSVLTPRLPQPVATRWWGPARLLRPLGVLLLFGLLVAGVAAELRTSAAQAWLFSRVAGEAFFEMAPGPSPAIRFPTGGPYDRRLGYARLPDFTARLEARGFRVVGQARWSPRMLSLAELGVGPLHRERTQTGLHLTDRNGAALHAVAFPERVYADFSAIPPLIVDTLLFIENRVLLDATTPRRNPAVEWGRLARAVAAQLGALGGRPPLGASTLATQIEKYHHSPEGRTDSAAEKIRQMVTASLRAYQSGPDTRDVRRRIVVDYLNTIPLAAVPGRGEVFGLGDGLDRWFGLDLTEVNAVLSGGQASVEARGHTYRHVLALLVSLRRPTDLLMRDREHLERQVDHFLIALHEAGVVSEELAGAARAARLQFRTAPAPQPAPSFAADKATVAARAALAGALGINLYELERLDLSVTTTLDGEVQRRVSERLLALSRPEGAVAAGLLGPRLLAQGADTRELVTSFSLWERTGEANLLRVQVDTLDQPFVVGEGMRLDLGSTAKLRTLVHYLSIVAELHRRYTGLSAEEIAAAPPPTGDPIARFVTSTLAANPRLGLAELLDAALEQRYSASTGERFFTGGGIHRFRNFDGRYEGRQLTPREAFRDSVNLPFVRLMRDVVDHVIAGQVHDARGLLADASDPRRQAYLERHADRVARERLASLYPRYRERDADERLAQLVRAIRRPTPTRLAVAFRSLRPEADAQALAALLAAAPPGARADASRAADLHARYAPERFSLEDRAYLARVHPLELWLAAHLEMHPQASLGEVLEASGAARAEASAWLFRTRHKRAQDRAIRIELERDAFAAIHRDWRALGYPFATLVPSLATAIGSSGDRPAALSELLGVLLSDGFRLPSRRIEELYFAEGTPYGTRIAPAPGAVERVLPREVAAAVRELLFEVVEQGTALRARNAFRENGRTLPIRVGGKTGTGDNREKRFAPGGQLVASHPRSRTATFAFVIEDRFFGVVTTHVLGAESGDHAFTSSLPAQIFKVLAEEIAPLVAPETREPVPAREAPGRAAAGDARGAPPS